MGSNHSDVNHWFPKHGKSMATARKDVAALLAADKSATSTPVSTTGKTYSVVTTINKYATASDAQSKKNSKGTYEAGTYYIYSKYPNGYNGMYNISTDKTGASAGSWINPAENVVPKPARQSKRLFLTIVVLILKLQKHFGNSPPNTISTL